VEIAGPRIEFNMSRWPVRRGNDALGFVTSAIYSPRLKKNIGYAWVPSEHASFGTQLVVESPSGDVPATVVRKPFVDPEKEIPKS